MTQRLYRAGLQRSDVIFTDLVWCSTKDAYPAFKAPVPPTHEEIKFCWKTWLGPFLKGLPEGPEDGRRPRHLIPLGDWALRWFKGLTQKQPAMPHYGTSELHELPSV